MLNDDRWIKISGRVVFDNRTEAKKAMLEANPSLKKIYSVKDKIFEVFGSITIAATPFGS